MKSSTRTFQIPNNAGSILDIRIHEDTDIKADNLHLETWGSSLVLARRLHSIVIPNLSNSLEHRHPRPRTSRHGTCGPVIELGAGTGLVGISAAAVWGTNVTLTDLSPIVPALAQNISLNQELLSSTGGSASSGALDWTNRSFISLHSQNNVELQDVPSESNKASVILAADTVYDPSHPEMLANVIKTWLRPGPDSRFLIAFPPRVAYLEELRELWERLEGIGLQVLEEGKESLPPLDWDDEVLIEWSVWGWNR